MFFAPSYFFDNKHACCNRRVFFCYAFLLLLNWSWSYTFGLGLAALVVLVLQFWSWSYSLGLGLNILVLFPSLLVTSLVPRHFGQWQYVAVDHRHGHRRTWSLRSCSWNNTTRRRSQGTRWRRRWRQQSLQWDSLSPAHGPAWTRHLVSENETTTFTWTWPATVIRIIGWPQITRKHLWTGASFFLLRTIVVVIVAITVL